MTTSHARSTTWILSTCLLGLGLLVASCGGNPGTPTGDGGGTRCQTDTDCKTGERCYQRQCEPVPSGSCSEDSECSGGRRCVAGECVVRGDGGMGCRVDEDCEGGATCESGLCRGGMNVPNGGACTGNSDCQSGYCLNGLCTEDPTPLPGDCASDADCVSGTCVNGVCQGNGTVPNGGACTGNDDCISRTCVNGFCEGGPVTPMCTSDGDCAQGSTCQNGVCRGSGQVPNGSACTGNGDCTSGLCLNGTCRPVGTNCVGDADCATGSTCTNNQCQGTFQVPNGGNCTGNGDCVSTFCMNGVCAERPTMPGTGSSGPGAPGGTAFPPPGPGNSNNVVQDPGGNIVLPDPQAASSSSFLWVANDFVDGNQFNGTVSKIDTRTGVEVARYRVGLGSVQQQRPSRTAIDLRGDAYVASRALGPNTTAGCGGFACFADQGSATKIANNTVDCIDKNGNGTIETSTGPNDVYPYDPTTGLSTDECVVWSVPVGPPGSWPRALAVGLDVSATPTFLDGIPWVGTYYDRQTSTANPNGSTCGEPSGATAGAGVGRAYKLDPRTGAVLNSIQLPINPYGFAVDSSGLLWSTSIEKGRLAAVDLRTEQLVPSTSTATANCSGGGGGTVTGFIDKPQSGVQGDNCTRGYGMAVDRQGRVWTAGFDCRGLWRYTPGSPNITAGTWTARNLNTIPSCTGTPCETCTGAGCSGNTRGVAVGLNPDAIWMAHSANPTRLTRLDPTTLAIVASRTFSGASGAIGVQSDFDGDIWVVNQSSNNATRYNIAGNTTLNAPTNAALVAPYTYSDFTGFALRTFTRPNGSYAQIFAGCPAPPTAWGTVTITGTEPANTQLQVRVRTADTMAGLSSATYSNPVPVEPGVPIDISTLATGGAFIQVEVLLISTDNTASPSLSGISVSYACPTACTDPSNCPGGLTCVNQACAACTSNDQCPSGTVCINGTCATPPGSGCTTAVDCPSGQVCVNGTCAPCTTDAMCSAGQVCQNGTCVNPPPPAPCGDTDDCPDGQVCQNGTCQACGPTVSCGTGLTCRNGTCTPPECNVPSDCPQTQACIGGFCGPCRQNSDCEAGNQCVNGSCVPVRPQG